MAEPADPAVARALLAVARMVAAELERAALVADDVPELVLATVARWCDGAATEAEVRAVRGALYAPRPGLEEECRGRGAHQVAMCWWRHVAHGLGAYVGGGRGTRRARAEGRTLAAAWVCLRHLGEPEAAAKARVEAVYGEALARATRG